MIPFQFSIILLEVGFINERMTGSDLFKINKLIAFKKIEIY